MSAVLKPIYNSMHVLPQPCDRVEVLLGRDTYREPYPSPVRFGDGRWRDAKTGQIITDLILGWRQWPHGAASKRPVPKKRGPTPKLDHAYEQLVPKMTRRQRKTVMRVKITEAYAARGLQLGMGR